MSRDITAEQTMEQTMGIEPASSAWKELLLEIFALG
jgi:hypothetical protein